MKLLERDGKAALVVWRLGHVGKARRAVAIHAVAPFRRIQFLVVAGHRAGVRLVVAPKRIYRAVLRSIDGRGNGRDVAKDVLVEPSPHNVPAVRVLPRRILEDDFAYDPVEIKKAFNERKAAIEQMQINARTTAPKQGAGSANAAEASSKKYDWE